MKKGYTHIRRIVLLIAVYAVAYSAGPNPNLFFKFTVSPPDSSEIVLIGTRNYADIKSSISRNLPSILYTYNKYLHDKSSFEGKITVKIAIAESGKVTSVQVVKSTINDFEFEAKITEIMKNWEFRKIDKPNDVTVAIFPLEFTEKNAGDFKNDRKMITDLPEILE